MSAFQVVRPVQVYWSETWAQTNADQDLPERTEMNMLIWVMGIKRIDKSRTEEIKAKADVADMSEKIREARPRWLGHV